MSDIVERLLAPAYWISGSSEGHEGDNSAPIEAAKTIESLRAELAKVNMEVDRLTRTNQAKREHRDKLLEATAKMKRMKEARFNALPKSIQETILANRQIMPSGGWATSRSTALFHLNTEQRRSAAMSDIVERLRRRVDHRIDMEASHTKTLEWQAADEIERLRAALDKMQRSRDRYRQAWEAEKARAALGDER